MTALVDLVNFNADASCLDSGRWLQALEGGPESEFCQWLALYAEAGKKLVLGLTGSTLADIAIHNPEALTFIQAHPGIFEGVVRPFSHDIALIRGRAGYALNLRLGARAIARVFPSASRYYLPPEFMLSNEQTALLAEHGCDGVFVNAERLEPEMRARIPNFPYWLRGVNGTLLRCLPVSGGLTQAYLDSLHRFDSQPWNTALDVGKRPTVIAWRDGESAFLIPNGVSRERAWLAGESGCQRAFLSELTFEFHSPAQLAPEHLRSYPTHSFLAWMKEFRMMGYLARLQRLEPEAGNFTPQQLMLWLQAINSDVMSAVEKRSPHIRLRSNAQTQDDVRHTILRSERGFEGEECLFLLERSLAGENAPLQKFLERDDPAARKFHGRLTYLAALLADEDLLA